MEDHSKYSSLCENSQSEDSEESWPLSSGTEENYYGRETLSFYKKPLPWIISTFCLLAITILLMARDWRSHNALVATRDLSLLEWEGAREFVKTRYVKFNSGLVFNETGDLVRTRNEKELDWVGTPTEEMDKAWTNITTPQDLFATEDEVKNLGPNEHLIPEFGLYEVE
ncbi:hypothetical protein TARUN_1319 [Trichoderma arundinaceum]|uniref:Uncharacterized protein n=1 Tax=Trichoderma arundinaceum TaxID=490622 RepID=A0A395NXQ4_TRIAR|nr:hypothetical protein TARUN_1319 [Trichoderma arundinaceum]